MRIHAFAVGSATHRVRQLAATVACYRQMLLLKTSRAEAIAGPAYHGFTTTSERGRCEFDFDKHPKEGRNLIRKPAVDCCRDFIGGVLLDEMVSVGNRYNG